jgi:hypothetical protein
MHWINSSRCDTTPAAQFISMHGDVGAALVRAPLHTIYNFIWSGSFKKFSFVSRPKREKLFIKIFAVHVEFWFESSKMDVFTLSSSLGGFSFCFVVVVVVVVVVQIAKISQSKTILVK